MTEEQKHKPGRRAVSELLIAPLEAEGMRRKRGQSVQDLERFLERLKDRLAYAAPDTLRGMVPGVKRMAVGPSRDVWPSLLAITNLAHDMQAPPDRSDDVLYSWFHSRAGVTARRRGTVMAERAYIKRRGRPPVAKANAYGSSRLLEDLTEEQRRLDRSVERIRQARANGDAPESDLRWLAGYEEALASIEAIIDEGIEHRAAQAEAAGAAA